MKLNDAVAVKAELKAAMASKTMTKTNADPMIRAVRVDDEGCVAAGCGCRHVGC